MKAKILVYALLISILGTIHPAEAQQAKKIPRIGFLLGGSSSFYSAGIKIILQRLRELGYDEEKSIVIESRYAEGKLDRLPDLAAELVHLKVDIIVTSSTPGVLAAKKASRTVPIVFITISDPVGSGLVASLSQPGGNITGMTILAPQLAGKRLELLKEAFPKISRIAVLWNSANAAQIPQWKEAELAGQGVGVQLQSVEIRSINDFDGAFAAIFKERAQALLIMPDPLNNSQAKRIVDFATKNRLPAMYPNPEFVDGGGLMSYSHSYTYIYRRVATYVNKILKGAKPGNLPVEQPMEFEFVINLQMAGKIGVIISPDVLVRAHRVIN